MGRVINAPDSTLMPGMIDLHMHLFQWGQDHHIPWQNESILEAGLRGIRNASALLDLGVTTARDVASRDNLSIQLRDLINAGAVRGPRYYATGTQLEATGRAAYFFPAIYINGPAEAQAAARRQMRAGADWIKIMSTSGVGGGTGKLVGEPGWQELTEEEIHAAVVEAHHPGRKITTHAIGLNGIKAALRAGVDCIEHGSFLDEEAVAMMVDRDVPMVPTMIITRNLADHGVERGFEKNIVERAKRTLESAMRSSMLAHRAGVRVATGSDVDLDETAAQEVRMLIEAGFTPMEAVLAATRVAATVLDLEDELGTVEQGKVADLILVEGNPLEDPLALDRVTHVIHNGELVKSPVEHAATLSV
jgi:imidazolonepropionase-like amidohydrolase